MSEIDPYRSYNFKMIIEGTTEGHFMECSGLSAKIEQIKYREAGNNQVLRKLPGQVEYGDITLKYGLTDSISLWKWFQSGVQGNVERKNITIQLLNNSGTEVVIQWNLINAWITEWKGTTFNAMKNDIAIETISLSYDSLDKGE